MHDPERASADAGLERRVASAYDERYDALLATAKAGLGDTTRRGLSKPEDIVGEATVKILAGEVRCRHPDRFLAFFHGVIRNVVRNHRRRRSASADGYLPESDELPSPASLPWSPYRSFVVKERWTVAMDLLEERLTPREREVFLMREWDGMGDAEIAEDLGIAPGTVKVHLRSARRKLREVRKAEGG